MDSCDVLHPGVQIAVDKFLGACWVLPKLEMVSHVFLQIGFLLAFLLCVCTIKKHLLEY